MNETELDLEKKKIKYSHWYEMFRIVVEKLLLGGAIVLIGIYGNQAIETYKAEASRDQLLLQKRLDAIFDIMAAYGAMHDQFDWHSSNIPQEASDTLFSNEYERRIRTFISKYGRFSALFTTDFLNQMEFYRWIHEGLRENGAGALIAWKKNGKIPDYRAFMEEVRHLFNVDCKLALDTGSYSTANSQKNDFRLLVLPFDTADKVGAAAYFNRNVEKWLEQRKQ